MIFHFLGGVVIGLQAQHFGRGQLGGSFHFGMNNVIPAIEQGGFPENYVFHSGFVFFGHKADTFEPNQLDGLFAVCKHRREPLPFSFTDFFEPQNFSFNLNERHILGYFTQFVEPASVYISVGIMPQQILDRVDRKFFVEHFGFFRPDTRQKFNVLI